MVLNERTTYRLGSALCIFIVFGIFANWLTNAVDRKRVNELAKSEIRIAQIKDECNRKVEENAESLEQKVQIKVDKKMKTVVAEEVRNKEKELRNLNENVKQLTMERDKLKEKLNAMNEHFFAYKKKMEEQGQQGEANKAS
uniref:Uncharacterized protein LOC100180913 n=1 Tax=Phallusia mammillata TaxID=59560 RepID=A0A6F9DI37_9ASCI|nr:uncharacterized protein LOC100180913 [Phallusia mammillata]